MTDFKESGAASSVASCNIHVSCNIHSADLASRLAAEGSVGRLFVSDKDLVDWAEGRGCCTKAHTPEKWVHFVSNYLIYRLAG